MRHKRPIQAFSAALLLSAAVAFAGTEKPNIVFVLADEESDLPRRTYDDMTTYFKRFGWDESQARTSAVAEGKRRRK